MRWLVTGGAGFIGAHVARSLRSHGNDVVILDNLSTGYQDRVEKDFDLVIGDCEDSALVSSIITKHNVEGVVHLAAHKQARESERLPFKYWTNNILACLGVLKGIENSKVKAFILSSSCSVYGSVEEVTDLHTKNPISPYGRTKATSEEIVIDFCNAAKINWGILRYFNVIGCGEFPNAFDDSLECIVPVITRKLLAGSRLEIFGNGFSTPDGTALRDYLDVRDLAEAHTYVAKELINGEDAILVNVATGKPTSVLEIATTMMGVAGINQDVQFSKPKVADPEKIWGNPSQRLVEMGWLPQFTIKDSLQAHWAHFQS
jgi:UDP-glucose 4-epimerase